jgi:hypothetical protein
MFIIVYISDDIVCSGAAASPLCSFGRLLGMDSMMFLKYWGCGVSQWSACWTVDVQSRFDSHPVTVYFQSWV